MSSLNTGVEPAQALDAFFAKTAEPEPGGDGFGNVSARTLGIDVDGGVWLKPGAAIAYRGDLTFARRPTLQARSLADAVLHETAPLVRATGRGRLYCGSHGAHLHVVRLDGGGLVVAWHDLIAFETTLDFEPMLVGHGVGLAAGGLTAVRVLGHGALAIAAHGRPLTLRVTPGQPVRTDPHATLAWSAELEPRLRTDLSWRSCVGHGGQEAVQMHFEGAGAVVVQPYEDPARFTPSLKPLRRVASLVTR